MLSIAEVHRRYGIDEYLIYKWADEGLLNVVPVGQRFKYLDHEVRAAIAKCSYHLAAA